jgi:hypothetical protein
MKTRLPVRSALFKHDTGGLVVKWVTISESLLLYVFVFCFCHVHTPLALFFLQGLYAHWTFVEGPFAVL